MPESWLKNAIRMASRIGTRSRRVQKRPGRGLLVGGGQDLVGLAASISGRRPSGS